MLYLVLKIASAVGMGLVLKRSDAHSIERLGLIRINYAVAAVIGFFATVAFGQTSISRSTAILAAGTGVLFVLSLLVWTRAIKAAGLALSVVAMRTGVIIPLLAAALFWRERPTTLALIGSAVALIALTLVLSDVVRHTTTTAAPVTKSSSDAGILESSITEASQVRSGLTLQIQPRARTSPLLWLFLLFLVDGLVMVPALVFCREMPTTETMPFQTVIFISAFFVTSAMYYARRPGLQRETLKWGVLLGTANLGNYLFLVLALSVLPGLVVYPAIAAGEVGLMAAAGVLLWKEKVGPRGWLGIALTIIALVLIQLGKSCLI